MTLSAVDPVRSGRRHDQIIVGKCIDDVVFGCSRQAVAALPPCYGFAGLVLHLDGEVFFVDCADAVTGSNAHRMAGRGFIVELGTGRDTQRVAVKHEQAASILNEGECGSDTGRAFRGLEAGDSGARNGVLCYRTTRSENDIRDGRIGDLNDEILLMGRSGPVACRYPHRVAGCRLVVDVGTGRDTQRVAIEDKQAACIVDQRESSGDIRSAFGGLEAGDNGVRNSVLCHRSARRENNIRDSHVTDLDDEIFLVGRSRAVAGGNAHRVSCIKFVVDDSARGDLQFVAVQHEQSIRIVDERERGCRFNRILERLKCSHRAAAG